MKRDINLVYLDEGRLYVNIGLALRLIQYHYEKNEDKFKEYSNKLEKELDIFNEDELARYIQAQMCNRNTFTSMGDKLDD